MPTRLISIFIIDVKWIESLVHEHQKGFWTFSRQFLLLINPNLFLTSDVGSNLWYLGLNWMVRAFYKWGPMLFLFFLLFPHFTVFLTCSVLYLSSFSSASTAFSDLVSSGFGSWVALTRRLSLPLLSLARGQRSGRLRVSSPSEVDALHHGQSVGHPDWLGTPEKALWRAGGCVVSAGHVDDEVGRTRCSWCVCMNESCLFCSSQLQKMLMLFAHRYAVANLNDFISFVEHEPNVHAAVFVLHGIKKVIQITVSNHLQ